jgi:CRISPR-associated endonuclease/helicase Cas3
VVNTKSQAAEIFKLLQERADGGAFHLSTRMCAQHRLDSLERIRALARKDGAVCRVVSTQLVEAGVDLDFPAVLRAMAPLDAMIQAAGRCDREGALSEKAGAPAGELAVFRLDARNTPYGAALDQTESLINGRNVSLHEPDHVLAYFHRLYLQKDKDSKDIDAFRANLDFPKVAEEFGLIRDATRSVLAPYGDGRELIQQASSAFTVDQKLLRALQRYQVGLYPHEWAEAKRLGAIYQLGNDLDLWACMPSCYDPEMGLVVRAPDPAEFVC